MFLNRKYATLEIINNINVINLIKNKKIIDKKMIEESEKKEIIPYLKLHRINFVNVIFHSCETEFNIIDSSVSKISQLIKIIFSKKNFRSDDIIQVGPKFFFNFNSDFSFLKNFSVRNFINNFSVFRLKIRITNDEKNLINFLINESVIINRLGIFHNNQLNVINKKHLIRNKTFLKKMKTLTKKKFFNKWTVTLEEKNSAKFQNSIFYKNNLIFSREIDIKHSISEEIQNEVFNTISYMKKFGLTENDYISIFKINFSEEVPFLKKKYKNIDAFSIYVDSKEYVITKNFIDNLSLSSFPFFSNLKKYLELFSKSIFVISIILLIFSFFFLSLKLAEDLKINKIKNSDFYKTFIKSSIESDDFEIKENAIKLIKIKNEKKFINENFLELAKIFLEALNKKLILLEIKEEVIKNDGINFMIKIIPTAFLEKSQLTKKKETEIINEATKTIQKKLNKILNKSKFDGKILISEKEKIIHIKAQIYEKKWGKSGKKN